MNRDYECTTCKTKYTAIIHEDNKNVKLPCYKCKKITLEDVTRKNKNRKIKKFKKRVKNA